MIGATLRPLALGQGRIVVKGSANTASAASRASVALLATKLDHFIVVKNGSSPRTDRDKNERLW